MDDSDSDSGPDAFTLAARAAQQQFVGTGSGSGSSSSGLQTVAAAGPVATGSGSSSSSGLQAAVAAGPVATDSLVVHLRGTPAPLGPPIVESSAGAFQGDRRDLWAGPQKACIGKRRQKRGKFKRKVRGASICSGMAPEEEGFEMHDIPYENLFCCDNKAAAIQFLLLNRTMGCLFSDLRTLIDQAGAFCATHNLCFCSAAQFMVKLFIDILVAGISCRPYSMARGARGDFQEHPDYWMSEAWIACLLNFEPRIGILENVAGFVVATRRTANGIRVQATPLKAFMRRLEETGVLKLYAVKIFIYSGEAFMRQVRHRVYILFVHIRTGGLRAASRAERYVKDRWTKNLPRHLPDWQLRRGCRPGKGLLVWSTLCFLYVNLWSRQVNSVQLAKGAPRPLAHSLAKSWECLRSETLVTENLICENSHARRLFRSPKRPSDMGVFTWTWKLVPVCGR